MTIIERTAEVYADEARTKQMSVKSWELFGVMIPKEKNLPLRLSMSGCPTIYMNCSHQAADLFLAYPISFASYVKLKWHRMWH